MTGAIVLSSALTKFPPEGQAEPDNKQEEALQSELWSW